jgi:hypothetical protein
MRRIRASRPAVSRDELFRAVLEHYGLIRMTTQVASEMERILTKPELAQAAKA